MAPRSSTLAWKILWTKEPGRLQSMGSLRVGYDWVASLSLFTFMHWRRKWQLTPMFLPGESQGRGSLVGCCLWGHTELDTTEWLNWTRVSREKILSISLSGGALDIFMQISIHCITYKNKVEIWISKNQNYKTSNGTNEK